MRDFREIRKSVKKDYFTLVIKPEELDNDEIVEILKADAEGGDACSNYYMGHAYLTGDARFNVEKNQAKGFEYIQKSAIDGCINAIESMSGCYRYGYGVEKNLADAALWHSLIFHFWYGHMFYGPSGRFVKSLINEYCDNRVQAIQKEKDAVAENVRAEVRAELGKEYEKKYNEAMDKLLPKAYAGEQLEGEYNELRKKYNSLVDSYNALKKEHEHFKSIAIETLSEADNKFAAMQNALDQSQQSSRTSSSNSNTVTVRFTFDVQSLSDKNNIIRGYDYETEMTRDKYKSLLNGSMKSRAAYLDATQMVVASSKSLFGKESKYSLGISYTAINIDITAL